MQTLLNVSLRQKAVFISNAQICRSGVNMDECTGTLVANLAKAGFAVSEQLLHTLKKTSPAYQQTIWEEIQEVTGFKKNWTPLVKGWDKPTGESVVDHIITYFANLFPTAGTRLSCGHIIPPDTFPLERYNGCPFCGMPFVMGAMENYGQGSKLKVLELWQEKEAEAYFINLLRSKTALDATQADSLKLLLSVLPLPQVTVGMKETVLMLVDALIAQNRGVEACQLFTSPTDILRYLWYKHTGFLQIIEPKVLIRRTAKNNRHILPCLDQSIAAKLLGVARLKLKYNRKQARMVAKWMNNLPLEADKVCELMHPKRSMWVRFIRSLRLAEYSKRKGFEQLKGIMDAFYKQEYAVWQGAVDHYRIRYDADAVFSLLKQRPGLFARSLFANMLWFGGNATAAAFGEVVDKVSARLVLTLNMYAQQYFDKQNERSVKPLGGVSKKIAPHPLLILYSEEQLEEMRTVVKNLSIQAMQHRFSRMETKSRNIYIDPELFKIPLSIGDRSETVQDLPAALMGTRFTVEGDTVRLFMQWGQGLAAQHLDMDLSCVIAFDNSTEVCSFSRLVATGCKHSGDIRFVPNKVGTAEYIDLDIKELVYAGARYVTFTSNAYSNGSLTPNLVVGWMSSKYRMIISEKTGVAYDPSCVQHQVRISKGLSKGLVFGVLDVHNRKIIWLEMPFGGQVAQNMNAAQVRLFIRKLENKITIGQLLEVKAKAQNLQLTTAAEADEVYTSQWAMDTAGVTALLVD